MHTILHKKELAHEDAIWCCAFGRNEEDRNDIVVTGGLDNAVKVWTWDEYELKQRYALEGHNLGVISCDSVPFGNVCVSSSMDSTIRLWDLVSGKQLSSTEGRNFDSWTVAFSPDQRRIVTGFQNKIILFNSADLSEIAAQMDTQKASFVLSVSFSPCGKYLAAATAEGTIYIFDSSTCGLIHTIDAHAMPIRTLAFTPDSKVLISGSDDKYFKLHDIASSVSLIATVAGHSSWVLSVAVSPDGQQIATSSADSTVKMWEFGSRPQSLCTFKEHTDQVWGVRFNYNGSRLVSVSEDKSVNIYNVPI